jgi:hypothetical protein
LLRSRLGDRNDLGLIGSRSLSELLGELASFFFGQRAGLGFVIGALRPSLHVPLSMGRKPWATHLLNVKTSTWGVTVLYVFLKALTVFHSFSAALLLAALTGTALIKGRQFRL